MKREFTPEEEKELKKLAMGPLGKELADFPLRFSTSILIGDGYEKKPADNLVNGTATLLELKNRRYAITCSHVLKEFKSRKELRDLVLFQIGNLIIDPMNFLVFDNPQMDLAAIDLTEIDSSFVISPGNPKAQFFVPKSWPPKNVKHENAVLLGGLPGSFRKHFPTNEILFQTFSVGGAFVASLSETQFAVQFERENWVSHPKVIDPRQVYELGGISGGPVFIERREKSGLTSFELIGIIKEFSPSFDLLFAAHASQIQI